MEMLWYFFLQLEATVQRFGTWKKEISHQIWYWETMSTRNVWNVIGKGEFSLRWTNSEQQIVVSSVALISSVANGCCCFLIFFVHFAINLNGRFHSTTLNIPSIRIYHPLATEMEAQPLDFLWIEFIFRVPSW